MIELAQFQEARLGQKARASHGHSVGSLCPRVVELWDGFLERSLPGHLRGLVMTESTKTETGRTIRAAKWWGGGWKDITRRRTPDLLSITDGKVRVTKRRVFGLTGSEDEVSLSKVASWRLNVGPITSTIVIETTDGAAGDLFVSGLPKKEAQEFIEYARSL